MGSFLLRRAYGAILAPRCVAEKQFGETFFGSRRYCDGAVGAGRADDAEPEESTKKIHHAQREDRPILIWTEPRKGRKLLPVTNVVGVTQDMAQAQSVLKRLKSRLGCSGRLYIDNNNKKDGLIVELHGDHRRGVKKLLASFSELIERDIKLKNN